MASTRSILEQIRGKVDESMGVRANDGKPQLSPIAHPKDVGRRALRTFGTLEITSIIADPDQPRTEFDQEQLERLAQSIREKGQLAPIRVRWSEQHQKWIIISGERRYRATKLAGLPTVECHFHEGELSETAIKEQQLIENLLREDLKPIEEAKAFEQLMKLNNWNAKELSAAIAVSQGKIARSLALLKLPPDVQEKVESGEISARAAYEASKLDSPEQQRTTLAGPESGGGEVTIEAVQKQVRQRKGVAQERTRGLKQTFITEEGFKVTVTASRKGNYHEIEEALQHAIEEVRLRIQNNVQLS